MLISFTPENLFNQVPKILLTFLHYSDIENKYNTKRFSPIKKIGILLIFISIFGYVKSQTTYYSRQNGNWTNSSTWSTVDCGGAAASTAPGSGDNVVICDGNTVTLDANSTINDVTVNSGAILNIGNRILTQNGDLIINGNVLGQNGTFIFNGASDISGIGTIKSNNNACFTVNADITISATDLSVYSDINSNIIEIQNGKSVTNNGIVTVKGHIVGSNSASSWINAEDSKVAISGNFLATGTLYASAEGNTVEYSGAVSGQDLKTPVSSTYYNLTVSGSTTKTQQDDLIIDGDFTISSGTYDCNSKDLNIKGNWSCNGTFDYDVKTVTLDGTSYQSISSVSTQTFYNLTIDKSSGSVYLISDVEVYNTLTMTQGNISTGTNKITVGVSTTNYGTLSYTSGQVIGKYEKWFVKSVHSGVAQTFPVGTASYYRPAVGTFTMTGGVGSGGTIIAEFIESNPGHNGLPLQDPPQTDPDSVYNTFVDGYWSLTDANGISISGYNLNLTGNGFSAFSITAETRLLTRANYVSDWTNEGTHVSASGNTAYRSGLSTLPAEFCFGDDTDCIGPETSSISGDTDVCTDEADVTYTVDNHSSSTYTWTVTGGTISSGQGTNTIYVDWGSTGMVGKVEVVEWNSCTCGLTEELYVTINTLQPGFISGLSFVPVEQTGVAYSVIDTLGYTYYWDVDGGTIVSGDGTNSITVDWDANEGWGNVSVYATNGCGDSPDTDLSVWKYIVINSITTGNWGSTSTWDCNCVPLETDNVRINDGHTVTVNVSSATVKNFTITAAGILAQENREFKATGHVIIDGSITGTNLITFSGNNTTIGGIGKIENTKALYITGGSKTILSNSVLTRTNSDVEISAGLTVTNYGNFTIKTGSLVFNTGAIWENEEYSYLEIGADITPVAGMLYASATGNTVHYTGSVNPQVIRGTTYYNLYVTKDVGAVGNMNAATTVNNDFIVYSGTAATGVNNIEVKNNTSITGTFNIDGAGTKIFKHVYINSGGTWNNSANEAVLINGDIQNDGTFTSGLNIYTLAGFSNTVSGINALSFNTINTTGFYTNLTTVTAVTGMQGSGKWTQGLNSYLYIGAVNTTVSTFDAGSNINTVNYNLAGDQYVRTTTYYHLITSGGTGTKTLDGNVIVNGNFSIETGATCDASIFDYDMFIRGNWTNDGLFTPRAGKVTFDGSIVQTISGNTPTSFFDIKFNNSVGNNADIMINDNDISIAGYAEFTNGIVNTGDYVVNFANGSSSQIGNAASFIDGYAQKTGWTSFTFPIGHITDRDIGDGLQTYKIWAPFTAKPEASTDVKIRYLFSKENLNQWWSAHEAPLSHTTDREYWLVSSSADIYVTLFWKNNDPCSIHDFCNGGSQLQYLAVAYWDNIWKDAGGDASSQSTIDGEIWSDIAIPFSAKGQRQITFAGRNKDIPLPVELVDFYVRCNSEKKTFDIFWTTGSEINSDYFTVERSQDAISLVSAGIVDASGNSTTMINYSFTDSKPFEDITYYRLKQTDFDGKYQYSNIIGIFSCFGIDNQFSFYPNPAKTYINISVLTESEIEIVNMNGQIVYYEYLNDLNSSIDISMLSSGLYLIKVSSADDILIEKLIIE